MTYNTCRFCKDWRGDMIRYSTRHCAHPKCYLDRGRPLSELPYHQIEQFPFLLLKERGLVDEARRLIDGRNVPAKNRIAKIFPAATVTIALMLTLAAAANANAQSMRDCLANAASEYKRSWLSHCPGGVQYNFPACALGPVEAAEAKADWATARGLCFENHNAEAIDRADEMQRGPGLTRDEPEPPQVEDQPRRKFWISPQ